jgi:hypothetical protein
MDQPGAVFDYFCYFTVSIFIMVCFYAIVEFYK